MTFKNRLAWAGRCSLQPGLIAGFGRGIEPRNLRLCERGAAHVSLAADWAGMAQGLRDLGRVLATTLNQAVMLTQAGRFPQFEMCLGGRFAWNGCGGLGFDFGEWRRLWATRRQANAGVCCSLAIVGHDNTVAHQILLKDADHENAFARFARRFQGEPEPRQRPPLRGEPPCAGYHERFQSRKWEFVECRDSGAWQLNASAAVSLFEKALAARIGVRTTVVSASVVQSSLWTPIALEQHERLLTVTAQSTQLRLQAALVAELWVVPLGVESGGGLAVEFYDAQDRLLLGISAAPGQQEVWRKALSHLPVR